MRAVVVAVGVSVLSWGCFVPREQDTQPSDTRCTSCHGDASRAGDLVRQSAPPWDLTGNTDVSAPGVGAHQIHLTATATHRAIACAECHVVPATVGAPGHADDDLPAELVFGPFSTRDGGLAASYDPQTGSCANTACHGPTPQNWTAPRAEACGVSCHQNPPPAPHPAVANCSLCHAPTVGADNLTLNLDTHLDGVLQAVDGTCAGCHGAGPQGVPPPSRDGGTAVTARGVGAHQAHLDGTAWARDVACTDCHVVPADIGDMRAPSHLDGTVDVVFDGGTYQRADATCTSWCHAPGAATTSPAWTRDGPELSCAGGCHQYPPPLPHPAVSRCQLCHTNALPDAGFIEPEAHVNGRVDVVLSQTNCTQCHGTPGNNAAPPVDLSGNTATTFRGVGLHQRHVRPDTFYRPVRCEECHTVPAQTTAAGHLDGVTQVQFSGVAVSNQTVSYDGGTGTCQVYCHNPTTFQASGGLFPTPSWTAPTGGSCQGCHGYPPPAPHPADPQCENCHRNWGTPFRPDLHVDGTTTFAVP